LKKGRDDQHGHVGRSEYIGGASSVMGVMTDSRTSRAGVGASMAAVRGSEGGAGSTRADAAPSDALCACWGTNGADGSRSGGSSRPRIATRKLSDIDGSGGGGGARPSYPLASGWWIAARTFSDIGGSGGTVDTAVRVSDAPASGAPRANVLIGLRELSTGDLSADRERGLVGLPAPCPTMFPVPWPTMLPPVPWPTMIPDPDPMMLPVPWPVMLPGPTTLRVMLTGVPGRWSISRSPTVDEPPWRGTLASSENDGVGSERGELGGDLSSVADRATDRAVYGFGRRSARR
jgi:hypothetical protein